MSSGWGNGAMDRARHKIGTIKHQDGETDIYADDDDDKNTSSSNDDDNDVDLDAMIKYFG